MKAVAHVAKQAARAQGTLPSLFPPRLCMILSPLVLALVLVLSACLYVGV